MLKLYEFNDLNAQHSLAVLGSAFNVKIQREINGSYTLEFEIPFDSEVHENRIIKCEGQLFRIMKTSKLQAGADNLRIECQHVYNADAAAIHIQNIPDFIGKSPYEVLQYAFSNTPFTVLGDTDLAERGLVRMDYDGFLMDFFSMDKTTPFDVVNTIIENCGKGEIYIDNYNIALVEHIGNDTTVSLNVMQNMQEISIERDISGLITRLYPYGYEDLHIGTINDDYQYIDSPNIGIYGVREGYRDFSDYKTPEDIKNLALWQFDADNEERIDIPSVNITGKLVDLSKLAGYEFMKINLGDRITVIDGENRIKERVISLETYPYEPLLGSVSIGRVKRDLFFYLNQMSNLTKKYKKVATVSGKVMATAISGVVNADGIKLKDSSGTVTIMTDMIIMSDSLGTRFQCGVSNGNFVFLLTDKNGQSIYVSDDVTNIRGNVKADSLMIGNNTISVDTDGNLSVNGRKVVYET